MLGRKELPAGATLPYGYTEIPEDTDFSSAFGSEGFRTYSTQENQDPTKGRCNECQGQAPPPFLSPPAQHLPADFILTVVVT